MYHRWGHEPDNKLFGLTFSRIAGIHIAVMSMIPWMLMAAGSVAVDYINPLPQPGDPGYSAQPRHHFRFVMENDSAAGSDCNYSHGTRFDYAQNMAKNPHHAWGVSLVQNIYTPDYHTEGAVPGQHPYAGYLALGVAHLFTGEYVGCSTEFQLGTTGEASFAEDAQDFIHRSFELDRWEGWDDQIPGEVTFQLTSRQDYRLPWLEMTTPGGLQADATLFTREELGTVSIAGEVGAYVRFGRNLPDSMQMSGNRAGDYALGLLRKPAFDPAATSWYVLAGVSVKYVARDMFIDGGVFRDFDSTCSRKPWVAEGQIGFGVRHRGIDYYAGLVARSRNFRQQIDDTVFGTFNFGFHW